MSRRSLTAILIAAALPLTVLAGSTGAAKRAGVTTHDVDLTWKPYSQDLNPGSEVVLDTFHS